MREPAALAYDSRMEPLPGGRRARYGSVYLDLEDRETLMLLARMGKRLGSRPRRLPDSPRTPNASQRPSRAL